MIDACDEVIWIACSYMHDESMTFLASFVAVGIVRV